MYKNALTTVLIWLMAALVSGVFVWLLADIIIHGLLQTILVVFCRIASKCRTFRRYRPDYRIDGVDFIGCHGNGGTSWSGYGCAIK